MAHSDWCTQCIRRTLLAVLYWFLEGEGKGEASWVHMGSAVNVHEGLLAGVTPNFTHRLHIYL